MTKKVELTGRDGVVGHAIVDDEDYELVSQFTWNKHPKGYAMARINDESLTGREGYRTVTMHRLILGCKTGDGQIVDHVNFDVLDNRRENLRIATDAKSLRNRRVFKNSGTGYKGVRVENGNYVAFVHIGGFDTPEEAAEAYDRVIRKCFPGHPVNFPRDGETSARVRKKRKKAGQWGTTRSFV